MPCVKWRKAESDVGFTRARSVSIRFTNAILAAVGYNFRRLIRWVRILLCLILMVLFPRPPFRVQSESTFRNASIEGGEPVQEES